MPKNKDRTRSGAPHHSRRDHQAAPLQIRSTPACIDHFALIRRIGRGAMGEVFEAHDLVLDRRVALKLIFGHPPDAAARRRFNVEAQALGRLSHPNVVVIHELREHKDGSPYIVMELLTGVDLAKAATTMALADKVDVIVQVLTGLERVHSAQIIHRDLKPTNIFVTADGVAKILDFGLARIRDMSIGTGERLVGTLPYMAPEVIRRTKPDLRSDVYSIGIILFELIAGRRPFVDSAGMPLGASIVQAEPPLDLLLSNPEAAPLLPIVAKAIAKDPAHRYQSAQQFANELRACLDPVSPDAASPRPMRMPSRAGSPISPAGRTPHATELLSAGARGHVTSATPALGALPPILRNWKRVVSMALSTAVVVATMMLVSPAALERVAALEQVAAPFRRVHASIDRRIILSRSMERALCTASLRLSSSLDRHLDEGTPQAWTTAQILVALEPRAARRTEWTAFFASQRVEPERFWRKHRDTRYPQHLAVTAWVYRGLAHRDQPASREDLEAFLAEQQPSGAWAVYPSAQATSNGSSYVTALAILALKAQLGIQKSQYLVGRIEAACERAQSYLLQTRVGGRAAWSDYPSGEVKRAVSAFVLYALHTHTTPELTQLDQDWLKQLSPRPPRPKQFEASNRTIRTDDGRPIQSDDTRYYELPSCILATLNAYPAGTALQRRNALRWMEHVLSQPDPATGIMGNDEDAWIAAELLIAFRDLASAANVQCAAEPGALSLAGVRSEQ